MHKGFGIAGANRLADADGKFIENRDRFSLPQLKQKNYISSIATVLYLAMQSDDCLYDAGFVEDLLLGMQRRCYTISQMQQFLDNLSQFKQDWAIADGDNAGAVLKCIHDKHFVGGSSLSSNTQVFNLWLGKAVNQKLLGVLSIRTKQWLENYSCVKEEQSFSLQIKKNIGKHIFSLLGWSIEGSIDSALAKSVIVLAPHNTGFFDVLIGWSVRAQQPIPNNKFMVKKEAYDNPIYGSLLRSLGAMRVDREHPDGLVGSVVSTIQKELSNNLVITPEGTRKQGVDRKTGFYRIATQANVPLVLAGFDYEHKKVHLSDPIRLTGDACVDESYIKNWYEKTIPGFTCRLSLSNQ